MPNLSSGERTKLLMSESLRELMKKKPLDRIKIHEIVENCNLNRQTFYYHFQDIYALVEWYYKRDSLILMESYNEEEGWVGIFNRVMVYLEQHREEILCVLNSKAKEYFTDFVYKGVHSAFKFRLNSFDKGKTVSDYYKNFFADFYTMAMCGVVTVWFTNNNTTRMSSTELLRMLTITMEGNLAEAIERCKALEES